MVNIKTRMGEIAGIQNSNYQAFLGIPYVRPPTGNLRFSEPVPLEPWGGVKNCTKFGSIAPQHQTDTPPMHQKEEENCLFLNVWTPKADNEKRPVLCWIHGGAFLNGAGSRPRLNGARLAVHGNVVVVTFNYRLGALGFLNLSPIPPNLGIQDQVAALKWIKENISSFGGNPENITIFGESAGAGSVSVLLTIPSAKGLFQRAIMESGVAHPRDFEPISANKGAEKFIAKLKISQENIEELRQIPLKKLLRIQQKVGGLIGLSFDNPFRPYIDGKVIPEHPLESMRKGEINNVPIIVGNNLNEAGIIDNFFRLASDETKVKPLITMLKKNTESFGIKKEDLQILLEKYREIARDLYAEKPYKVWDLFFTDLIFRVPTTRQLEAYIKHQQQAYCYIFTHGASQDNNAFHTIEIPFVFGNLDTKDISESFTGMGEVAEKLSKTIMDTWVTFAKSGNPNHEGLPEWPTYDTQRRATMMFGPEVKIELAPMENLRKAWDNIL